MTTIGLSHYSVDELFLSLSYGVRLHIVLPQISFNVSI